MKKLAVLIMVLACVLSLTACAKVRDVEIRDYSSEIYSDAEIESAIDVAINYFRWNFSGCTLTGITYLGDEELEGWLEFAERHKADEVIVLVSEFEVGAFGDVSLNPNSTYTNWKWVLVRSDGGRWRHVDHGY